MRQLNGSAGRWPGTRGHEIRIFIFRYLDQNFYDKRKKLPLFPKEAVVDNFDGVLDGLVKDELPAAALSCILFCPPLRRALGVAVTPLSPWWPALEFVVPDCQLYPQYIVKFTRLLPPPPTRSHFGSSHYYYSPAPPYPGSFADFPGAWAHDISPGGWRFPPADVFLAKLRISIGIERCL